MIPLLYEWFSPQGIIALGVIYTAVQAWRSKRASQATAIAVAEVKADVRKVELATNSIVTAALAAKDATGIALAAAGVAEGRQQMRDEQEMKP